MTLQEMIAQAHADDFPVIIPPDMHDDVYAAGYDVQVATGMGGRLVYEPETEEFTLYM